MDKHLNSLEAVPITGRCGGNSGVWLGIGNWPINCGYWCHGGVITIPEIHLTLSMILIIQLNCRFHA